MKQAGYKIAFGVSLMGLLFTADGGTLAAQGSGLKYPDARKSDQVDDYHGTKVSDPYRWLEDPDSRETREWIEAQNAVTAQFFSGIPQRSKIRERLDTLWNFERYDVPVKRGGKYFYTYNSGLLNQSVLYVQDNATATARVLLDPNTLSADGTIAVGGNVPSANGKLLAYSVSVSGSDWTEVRVRDVATGLDLADTIKWIKFSSPAWTRDEKGFFYARYDEPDSDIALQQVVRNQKIYYHRIGTSQDEDILIHERSDRPDWIWSLQLSTDGQYLVLSAYEGSDPKSRIFYKDLEDALAPKFETPVKDILPAGDSEYDFVGNVGENFYFVTNLDAPRGRVAARNISTPVGTPLTTVVPESQDAIRGAAIFGGRMFIVALHDAHSVLTSYAMPTPEAAAASPALGERQVVSLPGFGSLAGISGTPTDSEVFFGFMSYLNPLSVYRLDLTTDDRTVFRSPRLKFDPAQYETRQVFYTSRDSTKVPMFITMKKGTVLDGNNPTLLYGYGGFNISLTPSFSPRNLVWLEMGGIYVVANLRGGGEYGSDWHRAGTVHQKQNVFDDFIAAAEFLVEEKYTSPEKLAINGGSNGGLLVGAVINQRPDLFAAGIPEVGVMDMLRFQKFTIGWAWTSDYGSSDDPEQFATLYKYSPLHNLREGDKYPAIMVMTADHDDRVVPGHSFKYAAALQAAQGGDAPTLIRIETKAGHGAGKPTSKVIDEAADRFSFLLKILNMQIPSTF